MLIPADFELTLRGFSRLPCSNMMVNHLPNLRFAISRDLATPWCAAVMQGASVTPRFCAAADALEWRCLGVGAGLSSP